MTNPNKPFYSAVVGSKLHRTDNETSDTDLRHVYAAPIREILSPFIVHKPTNKGEDETTFELSHFVRLLAKNNPTAMEIARSDIYGKGDLDGFEGAVLMRLVSRSLLDTEKYARQCNGFIKGQINRKSSTSKQMHHAARIATHLRIYLATGQLEYDCRRYDHYLEHGRVSYEQLLKQKRGEIALPRDLWEEQVPDKIWDKQDLADAEELVYNYYIKHNRNSFFNRLKGDVLK